MANQLSWTATIFAEAPRGCIPVAVAYNNRIYVAGGHRHDVKWIRAVNSIGRRIELCPIHVTKVRRAATATDYIYVSSGYDVAPPQRAALSSGVS